MARFRHGPWRYALLSRDCTVTVRLCGLQELYTMYPGFHHGPGTAAAIRLTETLPQIEKGVYVRPTDLDATR